MWGSIFSTIMSSTNYSTINTNNHYNFFIVTLENLTDEQRRKFIENMKIQIGMTFYENFKIYFFKKLPNSELLKYLQ